MTNDQMERRLSAALDKTAPDDVDGVLSRCTERKGTVVPMKKKNNRMKKWMQTVAACLAVLLLLAAIIVRCLMVARKARNTTESYVCVGVAAVLIFQTISNVGMCLFVLPVIGLTLPFFSYGGSSLVTLFAAMRMVSSVQSHSLPDWLR